MASSYRLGPSKCPTSDPMCSKKQRITLPATLACMRAGAEGRNNVGKPACKAIYNASQDSQDQTPHVFAIRIWGAHALPKQPQQQRAAPQRSDQEKKAANTRPCRAEHWPSDFALGMAVFNLVISFFC